MIYDADKDSDFSFCAEREITWQSWRILAPHSGSHQIVSRVTSLFIVLSSSGTKTNQSEVNLISSKWLTGLTFKVLHLGVWVNVFYGQAEEFTLLAVIISNCLHSDSHSFHIMKILFATVRMRDLIMLWNSSVQKKWHSKFKNKENYDVIYAAAEICCIQGHGDYIERVIPLWKLTKNGIICLLCLNNSNIYFFHFTSRMMFFFFLNEENLP